ncbi:MAG TPA: hypothetical protein HPP87_01980 [Planctomycetes bacterium]|nr:hypothetical protein [Planctomycetota bacterium]
MKKLLIFIVLVFFSGCASVDIQKQIKEANTWKDFHKLQCNISRDNPYYHNEYLEMLQKRRQWYIDNYNPSDNMANTIKQGRYSLGMTKNELIASIGYPTEINRTILPSGISEQWVYETNRYYNYKYFYFDNDILSTIQD